MCSESALPHAPQSGLLAQRIAAASALASRYRSTLLFSGGVPLGKNCSEAEAMRRWHDEAVGRSGWRRSVLLETASRSTRENALLSVRLLRAERPRLWAPAGLSDDHWTRSASEACRGSAGQAEQLYYCVGTAVPHWGWCRRHPRLNIAVILGLLTSPALRALCVVH